MIIARVRTWWTIFRIALEERMVYRGDFALGTLMRFLPIVTQIFLWSAVFDSVGSERDGTTATVAGYSFENVVAYYLLTMVSRAFSSMPGLASGIGSQIRNGEVKKYLIQPVDWIGFLLLTRLAHKAAYYSVALLPFAFVFWLCRQYFPGGWPDIGTILAFAASLVLAFLLGFFLETALGMVGFWFLEVSSLLFIYMLLSYFLSGHMFPLDMLPDPWKGVVDALPFKYLAYFPAAVLLGRIHGAELIRELAIELGWLVFFIFAARRLHRWGVRRYSGFGG